MTDEGNYSIISDYLGTPVEAFDEQGNQVWSAELDIYGRVKEFTGEKDFIPFRYQGQYEDVEIGLYYNRFRYYDPEQGNYTQQDPIGLAGNPTLYGYVNDPNIRVDAFGLSSTFPVDPNNFTKMLGVDPSKVSMTKDGTIRIVWEPNSNTKIRFESHPEGISPTDPNWNPRHHGEHYHVETKPNELTWGQAKRKGKITKVLPTGYTPRSGTGFLSKESLPGGSKGCS